jgi:hypothetical protein
MTFEVKTAHLQHSSLSLSPSLFDHLGKIPITDAHSSLSIQSEQSRRVLFSFFIEVEKLQSQQVSQAAYTHLELEFKL